MLLLCFTLVMKFLLTSELNWNLLGKWLSLQNRNLVMMPKKKEEKMLFWLLSWKFLIIASPSTLQTRVIVSLPSNRAGQRQSQRYPGLLCISPILYLVFHISIKVSWTYEIFKNIPCFVYIYMFSIFKKQFVFSEDIL